MAPKPSESDTFYAMVHIQKSCSIRISRRAINPKLATESMIESITIAVPAYNESKNIAATLDNLVKAFLTLKQDLRVEAFVINDASIDDTCEKIRNWIDNASPLPPGLSINLVDSKENMGLVKSALIAASNGTCEYFKILCGDNAEPSHCITSQLDLVGQYDMIIPVHKDVANKSISRIFLSRTFTILYMIFSGRKVTYVNGCPILRRESFIRHVNPSHGFGFQAYLHYRLCKQNHSIVEVEITGLNHEKSTSSPVNFKNLIGVLHAFTSIALRRIYLKVNSFR